MPQSYTEISYSRFKNEKMDEYITVNGFKHIRYIPETFPLQEMISRSKQFFEWADKRRSVRAFSEKPVPKEIIENIIKTASTSPSGAHKQPWAFCAISNPEIKKKIREAAEKEELESYEHRMSEEWLEDLKPFSTDWHKPYLEEAPWLIAVFKKVYDVDVFEVKRNNYYVTESVGLACGMLLTAIHHCGLVALTHTPSPMNFLSEILRRPDNERSFLLIPVGFAADKTYVPDIRRKSLNNISVWYE
jgi:iodotyrosine deiodinase